MFKIDKILLLLFACSFFHWVISFYHRKNLLFICFCSFSLCLGKFARLGNESAETERDYTKPTLSIYSSQYPVHRYLSPFFPSSTVARKNKCSADSRRAIDKHKLWPDFPDVNLARRKHRVPKPSIEKMGRIGRIAKPYSQSDSNLIVFEQPASLS